MPPDVSIIIPARNEASNIGRCLDAVFKQDTRFAFEVILIDSGSTDDTVRIASSRPVKVIEIRAGDFDHGRTRNMGFEAAAGEYLVALVADAVPADERWLDELIAPLEEDSLVAGAYSRQVPPPDAHPLSGARFGVLDTSRTDPEVRSWPGDDAWENMDPMERLKLVEFNDVSSVRRRSVWERIPVADNFWGEDVDWSLKALRAGHKIAYAAGSVVAHGHAPGLWHDFKRAYVDQREVSRRFGITLYANTREVFHSWMWLVTNDFRVLKASDLSPFEMMYWRAHSPVRRFLEALGGYLGGHPPLEDNVVRDLYAACCRTKREGNLRKTVFSLSGWRCNTVFAHPPSRWSFRVSVKPGSKLEFLAGIHPETHSKCGPVVFSVEVEGERAWECELDPAIRPEDRRWRAGAVNLAPWEGRKIKVDMLTKAPDTQNAWAGWGVPRVTAHTASPSYRLKKRFLDMVERVLTRTPPRHP